MDSYQQRPSNFLLVRPEKCACKLSCTLLFAHPGSAPIWGGGEKGEFRVQGLDYPGGDLGSSKTTRQNK